MEFRIRGLPAAPFAPLFSMSDAELAHHRAVRRVADEKPGFPCRVSLADAEPGEEVLLLNYEHHAVETPYRASHAIFVRAAARETYDAVGEIPEALRTRLISLRSFDAQGTMIGAEIAEGRVLEPLVRQFLSNPEAAYLHAHFARRGCYAALIERAP
jgi:hypothetical protein